MTIPTTCPDCKLENQADQFCRWCAQHFGPNTNRPLPKNICPYCGERYRSQHAHIAACEMNPIRDDT